MLLAATAPTHGRRQGPWRPRARSAPAKPSDSPVNNTAEDQPVGSKESCGLICHMKKACALVFAAAIAVIGIRAVAQSPDGGRAQTPIVYPKPDASAVRSKSGQWKVSDDWATLPAGLKVETPAPGPPWGVVSAATSDAKGVIYVLRREEIPILAFEKGKLIK